MSTYCIRRGKGCCCPLCLGSGGDLGVGTSATTVQVLISVIPSRRQIRVSGMCLTNVRSVFLTGSVQSSSTRLPERVAVKSSTRSGNRVELDWTLPVEYRSHVGQAHSRDPY